VAEAVLCGCFAVGLAQASKGTSRVVGQSGRLETERASPDPGLRRGLRHGVFTSTKRGRNPQPEGRRSPTSGTGGHGAPGPSFFRSAIADGAARTRPRASDGSVCAILAGCPTRPGRWAAGYRRAGGHGLSSEIAPPGCRRWACRSLVRCFGRVRCSQSHLGWARGADQVFSRTQNVGVSGRTRPKVVAVSNGAAQDQLGRHTVWRDRRPRGKSAKDRFALEQHPSASSHRGPGTISVNAAVSVLAVAAMSRIWKYV